MSTYDPTTANEIPTDYADWLRKKISIYEAAEQPEEAARVRKQLAEYLRERDQT